MIDAKELFSAGIRIVGLLTIGRALSDLLFFFVYFTGIRTASVNSDLPYTELYFGLFYFFVGLYLLRGAPLILEYAFPEKKTDQNEETETEQEDQNDSENDN